MFNKYSAIIWKAITDVTIDDSYTLAQLYSEIGLARAEEKYQKAKIEQEIKDIEATRTLELKSEMTEGEKPKNKYTEVEIKSIISQELAKLKEDANKQDYTIDRLSVCMQTIQMMQPITRDFMWQA